MSAADDFNKATDMSHRRLRPFLHRQSSLVKSKQPVASSVLSLRRRLATLGGHGQGKETERSTNMITFDEVPVHAKTTTTIKPEEAMSNCYTDRMECDGDCGAEIVITSRVKSQADCDAAAQGLGWTTRDHGKTTEVYCPFCQERAKRIVSGR